MAAANLNITLTQPNLIWENPEENFRLFEQQLENIYQPTDIIILPEMFNTGFSMQSEKLAENHQGKSFNWMVEMAKKYNAAVVGSVITIENNKYYNRLYWVEPNGNHLTYDKRHLFRIANEHHHFSGGNRRLVVEYKGWNIMPLVCYDLRFPIWSRNQFTRANGKATAEYDLLIYVANWPAPRVHAWSSLLVARAIENQAFVAGVNRVGIDGNEIEYSGGSALINPKGETISQFKPHQNKLETFTINKEELITFREKFPVGLDADQFEIKI